MKDSTINTFDTANSNVMLGDGIISYDGRFYLAEMFVNNAWFASPIYEIGNGIEVRPAGGNWFFIQNGAKKVDDFPSDKKKKVYQSWIEHLERTISYVRKNPNFEESWIKTPLEQINFWRNLLNAKKKKKNRRKSI